jgi:hypothetical protein
MAPINRSGILFRIILYLKNKFDPQPPVPEEVNTCINIVLKVLDYPDTELILAPISKKRFIVNKKKKMSITVADRSVCIINHVYSYTVYVESDDHYAKVLKKFNEKSEAKTIQLENEITTNIKHSLLDIFNKL